VRKLALLLATLASITGLLTLAANAENPATVTVTVTALNISVTVSPNSLTYGTRQVGVTDAIPSPAFFTVTNNGNVNENFAIKGTDSTAWELADTAGLNQYAHRFATSSQGIFASINEDNGVNIVNGVVPTGNVDVYLKMDLPTSTSATQPQNVNVSIIATQQ
jgi:hypothetical protein